MKNGAYLALTLMAAFLVSHNNGAADTLEDSEASAGFADEEFVDTNNRGLEETLAKLSALAPPPQVTEQALGRAGDALGFIERAEITRDRWIPHEWQAARLAALEALGRGDEAQAFRWACFERDLSVEHLRAFLKRLPDFEDIEAEERAMAHAAAHPGLLRSLGFFLDWPSPDCVARLLIDRHGEINGDHYEFLAPAAESLSERHPLAATLALRAMIDFTLTTARSKRYGYAARHLSTCADLARGIEDFGTFETHDAYLAKLKAQHGRKFGFWSLTKA